jgi:hypothetical protein
VEQGGLDGVGRLRLLSGADELLRDALQLEVLAAGGPDRLGVGLPDLDRLARRVAPRGEALADGGDGLRT